MKRIELRAVVYSDGDPASVADDIAGVIVAGNAVAAASEVMRSDDITPNAAGEYIPAEVEPQFDPEQGDRVTNEAVKVVMEKIGEQLINAAVGLMRVKDPEDEPVDDDEVDDPTFIDEDTADEILGLVAAAYAAGEWGSYDDCIDAALKRGGYMAEQG